MEDRNLSTSLVRGFTILSSFMEGDPILGITELATKLQLNKSTVHRYVQTLKTLGYLEQDAKSKKYRLGIRVVDLGLAALGSMDVRQVALAYLEELANEFGHTVNMSILDGNEIIYVERVRTKKIVDIDLHVGSRLPAYCTSMGKVLLAHLPQGQLESRISQTHLERLGPNTITDREELFREVARVRERGFAINNEELAYGLRSIAAPVRSSTGEAVAAINIAVHASMTSLNEMEDVLAPRLIATAKEISRRLGYRK